MADSSRTPRNTDDAFAFTREWNEVEKRILRTWIESGMTVADAEATLAGDLLDAAEEDGYDGP